MTEGPAEAPFATADVWPHLSGEVRLERRPVYLAPGRLYASSQADEVTTILGSCVAVCVFDAWQRVGGMNHFLLPQGVPASSRFGEHAVPMLVAEVLALGAHHSRLRAKIFGGASVLQAFRGNGTPLGIRNVEAAREALLRAGIPVVGEDVGGLLGRRLRFDLQTGSAWVRAIPGEGQGEP